MILWFIMSEDGLTLSNKLQRRRIKYYVQMDYLQLQFYPLISSIMLSPLLSIANTTTDTGTGVLLHAEIAHRIAPHMLPS